MEVLENRLSTTGRRQPRTDHPLRGKDRSHPRPASGLRKRQPSLHNLTSMNPEKKPRKRGPTHTWEIWCSFAAIAFVTLFGVLPEAYRGTVWNAEKAGQFGDFIGGYFGTIFLVVSVAVLVGSYRNQRFSNRLVAFESRFFELLKYHRDNTVEIEVEDIKGRRAFVSFIREWRLLAAVLQKAESQLSMKLKVTERAILSYLAFYHGSGPNARRSFVQEAVKGYRLELVTEVLRIMSSDWELYKRAHSSRGDAATPNAEGKELKPLAYIPFEGHHSRLAHYFRHMFHLVKYAADYAPKGTAQDYVDLVRAQLTTHEQAVLALHAASVDGAWRTQDYLQGYHLIKDIPLGFLTDEEFPVREVFPRVQYADASR